MTRKPWLDYQQSARHNTSVGTEKVIAESGRLVRKFEEVSEEDAQSKSLGDLLFTLRQDDRHLPVGFATTNKAFELFMENFGLSERLHMLLAPFHAEVPQELAMEGQVARNLVLATPLPDQLCEEVLAAYSDLRAPNEEECRVVVRSSVTEDGCGGHQETIYDVLGDDHLLDAIHRCFASAYTNRAIEYRARHGFDPLQVSLSVVVHRMAKAPMEPPLGARPN